ncbi:YjdF family protein [Paenibacillus sp. tmac-D7]|uniref:YjdF family protein n=1 Tax=Paenibacillus sp. tmac-D7 TaxID=2591462 RepID=UPI001143DB4B|nr:YjdF family protein [Paenibacillus sp. tmac-D7]
MQLTVYRDGEFWVGVAEEEADGRYKACRHVFGAEPHEAEVLEFINAALPRLFRRTASSVEAPIFTERGRINPKRLAREAAKEMERQGIRDLAKAALMAELEHRKKTRKVASREQKEADKARKREIAVQKAKAKHRGR